MDLQLPIQYGNLYSLSQRKIILAISKSCSITIISILNLLLILFTTYGGGGSTLALLIVVFAICKSKRLLES